MGEGIGHTTAVMRRVSFIVATLLLATSANTSAQRIVPSAAVGLHTGRQFLGVEVEYRPFRRVGFILRGEGLVLADEHAGFLGARIDVVSSPGVWVYATPMVGLHYCYTASLSGSATACPPADHYSIAAAGLVGVELRLGDRSLWSLGLETGAWRVEHDAYSQWVLSVILRRVLLIDA